MLWKQLGGVFCASSKFFLSPKYFLWNDMCGYYECGQCTWITGQIRMRHLFGSRVANGAFFSMHISWWISYTTICISLRWVRKSGCIFGLRIFNSYTTFHADPIAQNVRNVEVPAVSDRPWPMHGGYCEPDSEIQLQFQRGTTQCATGWVSWGQ